MKRCTFSDPRVNPSSAAGGQGKVSRVYSIFSGFYIHSTETTLGDFSLNTTFLFNKKSLSEVISTPSLLNLN